MHGWRAEMASMFPVPKVLAERSTPTRKEWFHPGPFSELGDGGRDKEWANVSECVWVVDGSGGAGLLRLG